MADYRLAVTGREVEIPNPPVVTVTGDFVERFGHTVLRFADDGPHEITYTAGYADVPYMLRAWILMRTASLYEHRSADSAKPASPHEFVRELLVPYISRMILE